MLVLQRLYMEPKYKEGDVIMHVATRSKYIILRHFHRGVYSIKRINGYRKMFALKRKLESNEFILLGKNARILYGN